MTEPEHMFVVSLQDVYREHGTAISNLAATVNRVDGKLDTLLAIEAERGTESRLRALERWKYGIPPAIITSAIALAANVL